MSVESVLPEEQVYQLLNNCFYMGDNGYIPVNPEEKKVLDRLVGEYGYLSSHDDLYYITIMGRAVYWNMLYLHHKTILYTIQEIAKAGIVENKGNESVQKRFEDILKMTGGEYVDSDS